jgi:hypothetical protein
LQLAAVKPTVEIQGELKTAQFLMGGVLLLAEMGQPGAGFRGQVFGDVRGFVDGLIEGVQRAAEQILESIAFRTGHGFSVTGMPAPNT